MSGNKPYVTHREDCPVEYRDDETAERLRWWTLLSADRTPTSGLTVGIAELAPGTPEPTGLHRHDQAEVYYIVSGEGYVVIDDVQHPVRTGSTVYIPGNAVHDAVNTGSEPMWILYTFPTDAFSDVVYEFQ